MRTTPASRRGAGTAVLAALLLVAAPFAAAPAAGQDGGIPAPTVVDATDPVSSAVAWSQLAFPEGGTTTALLGRDDAFADSLASGPAQGSLPAPLLLTPPAALDPRTAAELERLDVAEVVIFGGPSAVSPAVEQDLVARGYAVRRVAGPTRLETAVAAARTFHPGAERVLLARAFGDDQDPTRAFADSLGAGALGAAADVPVLLTQTEVLSQATAAYLAEAGIAAVTIVGGPSAVSPAVADALVAQGITVERIAGPTRAHTALEVAFATEEALGDVEATLLVEGAAPTAWASGFPAAAAAVQLRAQVLLTDFDRLPDPTAFLLPGLDLVCGPLVTATACQRAAAATTQAAPGDELVAVLAPEEVDGGAGQPDATAGLALFPTAAADVLCASWFANGLAGSPTGAHVHRGGLGQPLGDVVLTLATTPTQVSTGTYFACAYDLDPALVDEVVADPDAFSADVHTAASPDGAVRGALFDPAAILYGGLAAEGVVPGPGTPSAFGLFTLWTRPDDAGALCYDLFVAVGDTVDAVHLHRAAAGAEPGEVAAGLVAPAADGITTCVEADDALLADVVADPGAFAVDMHTAGAPGGAARGQLTAP